MSIEVITYNIGSACTWLISQKHLHSFYVPVVFPCIHMYYVSIIFLLLFSTWFSNTYYASLVHCSPWCLTPFKAIIISELFNYIITWRVLCRFHTPHLYIQLQHARHNSGGWADWCQFTKRWWCCKFSYCHPLCQPWCCRWSLGQRFLYKNCHKHQVRLTHSPWYYYLIHARYY